jgi:NADPH:quinone reductase-like Zn-dependent oxidoreductase
MKALIYERYGPPEVLQIKEVARPAPRDDEVLIGVHATTVTLYDCWMRSSTAPTGFGLVSRIASGLRKPSNLYWALS